MSGGKTHNIEILPANPEGVSQIVDHAIDNTLRLEHVNILVIDVSVHSQRVCPDWY